LSIKSSSKKLNNFISKTIIHKKNQKNNTFNEKIPKIWAFFDVF